MAKIDLAPLPPFNTHGDPSSLSHSRKVTLQPSTKRLFAFESKSQLHVIGSFEATIRFRNHHTVTTLHVLEGSHDSLLTVTTQQQ